MEHYAVYQVFFGQTKKTALSFVALSLCIRYSGAYSAERDNTLYCSIALYQMPSHPNTADVIFHGTLPATVKLYVYSTGTKPWISSYGNDD